MRKHLVTGWMSRALGAMLGLACCGFVAACEPGEDAAAREELANDGSTDPAARAVGEALGSLHWQHLMEIERSELAMRLASRTDVRAFADRMARDHRFLDRRLLQLSARMQVRPRTTKPVEGWPARTEEELRDLHGVEFDRAYLKGVIDAHDRVIGKLIEARALSDEVLEQTIRSMVPLLTQHRDLAFRLLARMPMA
jgi:predicted outer membrane protein